MMYPDESKAPRLFPCGPAVIGEQNGVFAVRLRAVVFSQYGFFVTGEKTLHCLTIIYVQEKSSTTHQGRSSWIEHIDPETESHPNSRSFHVCHGNTWRVLQERYAFQPRQPLLLRAIDFIMWYLLHNIECGIAISVPLIPYVNR